MQVQFDTRLKHLMEKRGLDVFGLSVAARVREQSIRAWLKGSNLPSSRNLLALASALDVSVDSLLGVQKQRHSASHN